jgi:hypothetical protein
MELKQLISYGSDRDLRELKVALLFKKSKAFTATKTFVSDVSSSSKGSPVGGRSGCTAAVGLLCKSDVSCFNADYLKSSVKNVTVW